MPEKQPSIVESILSLSRKSVSAIFKVDIQPIEVPNGLNYIRTTKYTVLTFLPKNLYMQFRRAYNIYFLLACFSLIGGYASVSVTSMVGPLLIVLAFSAIKEALEDFNRFRADQSANLKECVVVRGGKRMVIPSKDIVPGDILYYEKGGKFDADCILISSSYEEGTVFVETAELDGETNLKRKACVGVLSEFVDPEKLQKLHGSIECEHPNENLISFEGRINVQSDICKGVAPLSMMNMALRGSVLKNTEFAYGIVVYTGSNTKIIKNLKQAKQKTSTVEHALNKLVIAAFVFNMVVLAASVIVEYFSFLEAYNAEQVLKLTNVDYAYNWYLGAVRTSSSIEVLATFLSFFALYTYIIPISLFVTIEMVRLGQATQMAMDPKMAYRKEDKEEIVYVPMRASNSSLNEDLGRVEYIFSDKTGTFTQNEMRMARWFVSGYDLDEMNEKGIMRKTLDSKDTPEDAKTNIRLFGRALALCHGVIPAFDQKLQKLLYESQSPDESALLEGAKSNGFVLLKRNKSKMTIEFLGQEQEFAILDVIEFDSARKRMSVVVRTPEGIHVYCKGADNIMFERIKTQNVDKSMEALTQYANIGLRTLVFGYRCLSEEEYQEFKRQYEEAQVALHQRDTLMDQAAAMIEKDFELIGCTAIEDRLQDRVPETIEYLLKAGIKLWLLTGDKQETAINIGMSSRLISPEMTLLILNAKNPKIADQKMNEMLEQMRSNPQATFALVVNGDVLTQVMAGDKSKFLQIGTQCRSVICTRVTPLQKSQVVKLVKDAYPSSTTLAIGDGANDVSMIQEAHIGVGIMGKEGTQAVRASDYAFGEFRFLQRLLTVHGRYNYLRLANLIYYCFYKNIVFIMVQFYFGFNSLWTGQLVYEELFFTAFNVVFTSLPPLFYGIYERDIPDTFIDRHPQLYNEIRKGVYWNFGRVLSWFFSGMYHSGLVYICVYFFNFEGQVDIYGRSTGYWVQAYLFSTPMLVTVLFKQIMITRFYVWPIFAGLGLSLLFNILVMFMMLVLDAFYYTDYATSVILHALPSYYILCVLLPAICILPDLLFNYFKSQLYPTDTDLVQEQEKRGAVFAE
ncbi:hypothetical protein EDD86DRAFT_191661 [Gorgonomyces haynaldii]|nr:hypothetical protein EDD86DRAFT_191661 [Gorgonomyces haynaldii]